MKPSIIWFRNDLRTDDQPALLAASQNENPLLAVFIQDENDSLAQGAASQWWLHHSLLSLKESLKEKGIPLVIRKGNYAKVMKKLALEVNASAVYYNEGFEPYIIEQQKEVKRALAKENIDSFIFNASLLFHPQSIHNKQGRPYQVFTPFYNTCLKEGIPSPCSIKTPLKGVKAKISSLEVQELKLLPKIHWDEEFYKVWKVGEKAALNKLRGFVAQHVNTYGKNRDFPSNDGTSKLSPHLHFGEVSPRRVWEVVEKSSKHADVFLRQLVWREFAYHLLYHFPHTLHKPLKEEFSQFKWKHSQELLRSWQKGNTGYPIIDAAMQQLWREGWMHNRLRMVVGSFLVKDLRVNWLEGAKWFYDTLVDADAANNTLGWQWVAGCGADAAPYFRVFNPVLQGEKFDPEGDFIKKYLPVLKNVPEKWIHKPWMAPKDVLEQAGVVLSENYPLPVVDHAKAKKEALHYYNTIKNKGRS